MTDQGKGHIYCSDLEFVQAYPQPNNNNKKKKRDVDYHHANGQLAPMLKTSRERFGKSQPSLSHL